MNWSQLIGLVPFFASAGLALVFALSFKAWRRRFRRQAPLQGRRTGNLPGQNLVERVGHHHDELMTAIMLMYMALPIMFLAWSGQYIQWDQIAWRFSDYLFAVAALGLFGWGLYSYCKHFIERENARDGLIAERVTGMQLNRLTAQGCTVLHDVPADGFNIDHVVVAPRGIFAVETKSFRKPRSSADAGHEVTYDGEMLRFPDFTTKEPIRQAHEQACWLSRELREAIGKEVKVIPAVALPGWKVNRTEAGKRSPVWVFTPMGKGADFMAWEPTHLTPVERGLIAKAIALRFPSIED